MLPLLVSAAALLASPEDDDATPDALPSLDDLPPLDDDEPLGTDDDPAPLSWRDDPSTDDEVAGDPVFFVLLDEPPLASGDDEIDDSTHEEPLDALPGLDPDDAETSGDAPDALDELPSAPDDDDTEGPGGAEDEPLPLPPGDEPDEGDGEGPRERLPSWSDAAWRTRPFGAPAGAFSAVAAARGRVIALGDALLHAAAAVDLLEPVPCSLPARANLLSLEPASPHRLLLVAATGAVFLVSPSGSLTSLPPLPDAASRAPTHLGWAPHPVARLRSGEMVALREGRWVVVSSREMVALASCFPHELVAVARADGAPLLLRSLDGGASWQVRDLPFHLEPAPLLLALCGGVAAVAHGAGLWIARSSGVEEIEDCGGALALAFADVDPRAPLFALLSRAGGAQLYLARIDEDDRATLLAELPPGPATQGPCALAWDEARRALWVATPRGLWLYEPPR